MPHTTSRADLWGLGILIALALIISVYLLTDTVKTVILNKGQIAVKGYAEKKITSDYATWEGTLSVHAATLTDAYQKLKNNLEITLNYLKDLGVNEKEIQVSAVQTTTHYKYTDKGIQTNEVDGYTLRQEVHVHSPDVNRMASVANQITDLIQEGIEISSSQPQFFYTQIDSLKIQLLGEAAKDALARAQALAVNSNSLVGTLRSAHQGVFQITPAFSTTISDYGENSTSTIDKSVKAVITMEYGLN